MGYNVSECYFLLYAFTVLEWLWLEYQKYLSQYESSPVLHSCKSMTTT